MAIQWTIEDHVDDWLKEQLKALGLKNQVDFTTKSDMSDFLREALKGSAKTKKKTSYGIPDFHIEKYPVPIIFENKLGASKLRQAVTEAVSYAQHIIASGKFREAFAIGIAGNSAESVALEVYYVFDSITPPKNIDVNSLDFLENAETFARFYTDACLSEEEKQRVLIDSQEEIQKAAAALSKIMLRHSITAAQRVIYVSGMLLAMQDIYDKNKLLVKQGLCPDDLSGIMTEEDRDGVKILNQIRNYILHKDIPPDKIELMLGSFSAISLDKARDEATVLDKGVSKLLKGEASINKQIFTFIYENVFLKIDGTNGHLDIMGEMYSTFLKYALGDGKELGIVLTPPYVTKMMSQLLSMDESSRVMDLATGSAGFLISAMQLMIEDVEAKHGKNTSKSLDKIKSIKEEQLLGIELIAEMFTLAATNMILRGDGSTNIRKGDSFREPEEVFTDFAPNRILLNPPFTYSEKGMPFILKGLRYLSMGGLGAIIIQDSAGSGEATNTNLEILKNNQLLASIKMPGDLFNTADIGVQTSIYIFQHTAKEHDYQKQVMFIDFRNDGYKRTKRGLREIDNPTQRYQDIIEIYKNGVTANVSSSLWDIKNQVIMDTISKTGNDWNFEQHQQVDTKPTDSDIRKTVSDYLSWELSQVLRGNNNG